ADHRARHSFPTRRSSDLSRKAVLATRRNTPSGGPSGQPSNRQAEIVVDDVAMVRLLGPQDRLLETIEQQFPTVDVMVRGNRIRLDRKSTRLNSSHVKISY